MKKLLFILAMCLTVFATAQCPVVNLTQNAKWKFVFSQCFEDTTTHSYVLGNNIAYFDANKNLTYISYAALLDSLNVPSSTPAGNNHNIQFNDGGAFGASTDFNYNGTTGVFYIYDVNGDTMFSVNTQSSDIRLMGNVQIPDLGDSGMLYLGPNRQVTSDPEQLGWDGNTQYLLNRSFASTTTGALVITSNVQSLGRFVQSISSNTSTAAPQYQFFRSRGTLSAPSVPTSGSVLGEFNFGGYNGTSYSGSGNRIRSVASGTWTPTVQPAYFSFTTTDDNGSSFSSYVTKKGNWSILGTENDTTFTMDIHGTAAIVVTPPSASTDDTVFVKSSSNQVMGWIPRKRIALKGDTNTFGALTTGTINSGAITSTGLVQGTTFFATSSGNGFIISGTGRIKMPDGNGIFEFTNNTENGLNRINLGDNTASFPSIKRNGAGIDFVLADNSAPTFITATQAVLLDTVSSGNITMGSATHYSFSGTTATWTLPTIAASDGFTYFIKNRGSGNLTINSNAGGNDIYEAAAVNTITVAAGASVILHNDGTYFTTQ